MRPSIVFYNNDDFWKNTDKFPPIVYKYRDWEAEFHSRIITHREVFLSSPSDFEDDKDCKNFKRYDLMADDEIKRFLQVKAMERFPNNVYDAIDFYQANIDTSPLWDRDKIKTQQELDFQEYCKHKGVLSLTANPILMKMWNKYSNNGKGFVVGFTSANMLKHVGGGGEVDYVNELPIIHYDDSFETEQIKSVFTKEDKWSFEEEYRTIKFWEDPVGTTERQIKLPVDAYSEIIFGWNMPEKLRDEIQAQALISNLTVTYFETILGEGSKIQLVQL